jgi:ABC-type nitrate/sulfonate/bicarbonate transport system substrate-binding protein
MAFIPVIKTSMSIHWASMKILARWELMGGVMRIQPSDCSNSDKSTNSLSGGPLRLGFVPLNDSAPIIMAQELGLFEKYNLKVKLCREAGWATIRDKMVYGELEAAHALGTMPISLTFGLNSIPCDCVTGLVLSLNGNAITLSQELWNRGVRDGRTLRNEVFRLKGQKAMTFGVVSPLSSHNFLLRTWLAGHGVNPDRDVRIVTVPPPQMCLNLRAGNLDGYCVGEPWNSLAIQNGLGWCVATSCQLAPFHPEKVLMVQKRFATERAEEHVALLAALLEACAWCDDPANHPAMIRTLARPEYINVHESVLKAGFSSTFQFGNGRSEVLPEFTVFHQHDANEPTLEKSAWVVNNLLHSGVLPDPSTFNANAARQTFRPDIYQQAVKLTASVPAPAIATGELAMA